MTNDEETEVIELNGDEVDGATAVSELPGFLMPGPGERLMPLEDEDYEDFRARRRLVNKMMRFIDGRKKGYRPATRLVAGGLRNKLHDVYTSRPSRELTEDERAQRRAKNKQSRESRKRNR